MVGRVKGDLLGREAREAFAAAVDEYAEFHWQHLRREEDIVLPLAEAHLTSCEVSAPPIA